VDRGIEPVGDQRQRRTGVDLDQVARAAGRAGGQVTVLAHRPAHRYGDIENRVSAHQSWRGLRDICQVPAVVDGPPDQRRRVRRGRAEVPDQAAVRIEQVQTGLHQARVHVGGRPGQYRQHSIVGPLGHLDDMAIVERIRCLRR
jgi:hypothetical protein